MTDSREISSTVCIPDITNWCYQQAEMESMYTDLSNVTHNIFSIMPYDVTVVASSSLVRNLIGWRQSKTTGKILPKKVLVRQVAQAKKCILGGDNLVLDMTEIENDLDMKR
jgi:hypothetical protein